MTEIWDVYDENANKTGMTMERGVPKPGQYMLCVHIYIINSHGQFLMQKRSQQKQSHPGEWDVTGGAVLAGEESVDAAVRETCEEIGIEIHSDDMMFVGRIKRGKGFVDVYFARKDFTETDCKLQSEEVEQVKFVSVEEMLDIERNGRKREPEYMEVLEDGIRGLAL